MCGTKDFMKWYECSTRLFRRIASFRPETALLRKLGVNLPDFLCDVRVYVSAQSVDFLDLV